MRQTEPPHQRWWRGIGAAHPLIGIGQALVWFTAASLDGSHAACNAVRTEHVVIMHTAHEQLLSTRFHNFFSERQFMVCTNCH
jgi:hypothetical protein